MEKPAVLLLVDGHALVHRAYHAVPAGFMTSKGEPTNAVFGFTSILLKALEETRPEYAAVTFDVSKPTFRHTAYADYKATRPRMADDLRPQFARVHQVVLALNIPIFESRLQADDLRGCLAKQPSQRGCHDNMPGDWNAQIVTLRRPGSWRQGAYIGDGDLRVAAGTSATDSSGQIPDPGLWGTARTTTRESGWVRNGRQAVTVVGTLK